MIVVSDTAPLIFFGKINKLSIFKELYSVIYIPTEVWDELIYPITSNQKNIPVDIKLEIEARESGWLVVKDPEKEENKDIALQLSRNLGLGEAYAIALSKELDAELLLINDKKARKIAMEMGVNTKWITDVLLDAAKEKLIKNYQEFKEILSNLVEIGLWIKAHDYNTLLLDVKDILEENKL